MTTITYFTAAIRIRPGNNFSTFNMSKNVVAILGITLGIVFGAVASSAVWQARVAKQEKYWMEIHSNTLASLSAQRAVDAMLNHDRVALHVILQDLTAPSHILAASIFDGEGELAVRSGLTNSQLTSYETKRYRTPIAISETIAGSLEIIVLDTERSERSALIFLTLVAAISATLIFYFIFVSLELGKALKNKLPDPRPENNDEANSKTIDDESELAPESIDAKAAVELELNFLNCHELKHQLTNQIYVQTFFRLEELIKKLSHFYRGQCLAFPRDQNDGRVCYRVRFPSCDSVDEARFRAICFLTLLRRLKRPEKFPLVFNGLIFCEEDRKINQLNSSVEIAIVEGENEIGAQLTSRIRYRVDSEGLAEITELLPPALELLELHQQQLLEEEACV